MRVGDEIHVNIGDGANPPGPAVWNGRAFKGSCGRLFDRAFFKHALARRSAGLVPLPQEETFYDDFGRSRGHWADPNYLYMAEQLIAEGSL